MEIKIMNKIFEANDAWAAENRKLLKEHKVIMFNFIGSPGAGKTTLLEATLEKLSEKFKIAVIEGDIETTRDAERIGKKNVPVIQINTATSGNMCHLDANLVNSAIKDLLLENKLDIIIVENIGNLVCPAEFDIGENAKIAVLSTTEGDDKIEKYPLLFQESKALVITKMGLLKYVNFNLEKACNDFRKFNKDAPIFKVDSLSNENIDVWVEFLISRRKK